MNKMYCYALAVVLVCGISCQRNIGGKERSATGEMYPLKIDKQYYIDKFSNIFKDVSYVALEETRNSMIAEISKLEITNDDDIIVFDSRSGAVFRFSSDGKFINNIGFRGAGESEYILPADMAYNPFTNEVLVWDNGKSAILIYELNGELKSRIQLPWIISKFGIWDKDRIVCYMNNSEYIRNGEKGTNYKIIKRDGTIEEEFGEYGVEKSGFAPAAEHAFCFQQGRCLHLPPFSNTIYTMDDDTLVPVATFDLMDNTIPEKWLYGSCRDLRKKIEEYPNLIEITAVYETSKYYLLNLVRNHFALFCMVQKDVKNTKCIAIEFFNDIYGMVGSSCLTYAYNDKLYFAIEPSSFENKSRYLQKIPKDSDIKNVMMKEKEVACAVKACIYGSEGASAYIDSLESTTFKLASGEQEFIKEMSQKNNPIIQICTLK